MKTTAVDEIVKNIGKKFRCFGGGEKGPFDNPVAAALKDAPLQFAAGVDVLAVVTFVLAENKKAQQRALVAAQKKRSKRNGR